MPKKMRKSSSTSMKKPSQVGAKPVIQQAKRVLKPGKFGKEIEDIFAGRIKLKPKVQLPETNETKAEIARKKRKMNRKERNNNPGSQPRRQTRERTELDNNLGSEPGRETTERTELGNNPESEPRTQTMESTELDNNPESEPRKRQRRKRTKLDNNPGSEPRRRQRRERIPESGPRKRTRDGLKVFREDEIGFNKANAGGTRLCPFDCNCCF